MAMTSSSESPPRPPDPLRFEVRHDALSEARSAVQRWLTLAGADQSGIAEATLVVSELISNACEHGAGAPVVLDGRVRDGGVSIAVSNSVDAGAFLVSPEEWKMPEPLATRGRGLAIVANLADRVQVRRQRSHVQIEAFFAELATRSPSRCATSGEVAHTG